MSPVTALKAIGVFLALWGALPAQAAGALEEAQAKRSKAFNDYYTTYQRSSHAPQEATKLGDKIVGATDEATARAVAAENYQALKTVNMPVLNQTQSEQRHSVLKANEEASKKNDPGPDKKSTAAADKAAPSAGKNDFSAVSTPTPAKTGVTASSPKNETVIDGKNIPPEIKFGEKGRAPAKILK